LIPPSCWILLAIDANAGFNSSASDGYLCAKKWVCEHAHKRTSACAVGWKMEALVIRVANLPDCIDSLLSIRNIHIFFSDRFWWMFFKNPLTQVFVVKDGIHLPHLKRKEAFSLFFCICKKITMFFINTLKDERTNWWYL